MAVVSEPAKAMLTAMVVTRESSMKSGWSCFARMNLERRSGFLAVRGLVDGEMVDVVGFWRDGKRSVMQDFANRATGKVTSMRPYLDRRR